MRPGSPHRAKTTSRIKSSRLIASKRSPSANHKQAVIGSAAGCPSARSPDRGRLELATEQGYRALLARSPTPSRANANRSYFSFNVVLQLIESGDATSRRRGEVPCAPCSCGTGACEPVCYSCSWERSRSRSRRRCPESAIGASCRVPARLGPDRHGGDRHRRRTPPVVPVGRCEPFALCSQTYPQPAGSSFSSRPHGSWKWGSAMMGSGDQAVLAITARVSSDRGVRPAPANRQSVPCCGNRAVAVTTLLQETFDDPSHRAVADQFVDPSEARAQYVDREYENFTKVSAPCSKAHSSGCLEVMRKQCWPSMPASR